MASDEEDKTATGTRRKARTLFLLLIVAVLFFLLGNLASHYFALDIAQRLRIPDPSTRYAQSPEEEVSTRQLALRLEEVSQYLDGDSLYRYTQGDLDEATAEAIRALLRTSEDPYAYYFTPEEYGEYRRSSEGRYAGIGVLLGVRADEVIVMDVYEGSPAYDAGVKPGDVLLAIDDDRHAWDINEATETIHRPAGESVRILWRQGGVERLTTLVLRDVNIPTIVSHLIQIEDQSVGYLHLRRFSSVSATEMAEVIRQLEERGATSLILDLRGNPGGFLDQAVEVTSLFVPQGVVVQIEDRKGINKRTVNGRVVTNLPLVVLIDHGSASASELVTAALQDHGRATVIGEVSYGKGTVQDISRLSWGGAIKYTIAHYMSPEGTTLDNVGVTPDILVPYENGFEEQDYQDKPTGSAFVYRKGADSQLDAALQFLLTGATKG
ncbi:MAG: S41 family peptidase [Coriobacteriia bacterium]|nr:S41 family peptidase [Coriobacteriia bacterium]